MAKIMFFKTAWLAQLRHWLRERKIPTIGLNYILLMCALILVFYSGIVSKSLRTLTIVTYKQLDPYPVLGIGTPFSLRGEFKSSVFDSFCERHKDIVTIIPTYSAAENFKRRKAIRDTIGKECVHLKCAVFFIVGVSLNDSVYEGVRKEYTLHKDILMVGYIDTYRHLNNKAIAMLNWLVRCCQQPKYMLHIIDDTYPNIRYFNDHLNTMNETKFILGRIQSGALPVSDASNKWYASKLEYPRKTYPTYVFGTMYAFLNKDTALLRDVAYQAEHWWIEDVWITGYVREKAGFTLVNAKKAQLDSNSSTDPELWSKYAGVHQINITGFYDVYKATNTNLTL